MNEGGSASRAVIASRKAAPGWRRLRVALPVFLLIGLLVPADRAGAQSLLPCSGAYGGSSKVSQSGPFEIGKGEVVELKSKVDGAVIQVGFIRPDAAPGYRSPVIVQASPYFQNDLRDVDLTTCNEFLSGNFVPHGYTIAFVPTRGGGGTDSCADLMGPKERSDLDQAVTWLGQQSWSNGKVGMTGISYDGSTPWEVASMGNRYLKTIVPASGIHNLFDLIYERGRTDWRWWFFVAGYYQYYGLGLTNPAGGRDVDRYARSAVCDTTDEGLTATVESYLTTEYDNYGYWADRNMDPDILKRYRGSVLLVQGLQDWNVDPGLQYPFINELEAKGVYVKQLLGQWAHAFPDGNYVGPRGDYADILLEWWDRWLKGDESADIGPRVEVQDSDLRWRRETAWPPSDSQSLERYLTADGTLSEAPAKGEASAVLAPGTRNRYFYVNDNSQSYNDLPIDHACATCVTFTESVEEHLRLVGIPDVKVHVTPAGPRGYVSAYLFRIDGDGAWHKLGWGIGDLRFPNGEEVPQEVTPGQEIALRFPLQPLDAIVHPGDQLMLLLDQGHSDHMPSLPYFPVEIRYGAELGTFRFETTTPDDGDFFDPPKLSE
jgi:putative CocE/NonD family hydrolase